MEDDKCPTCPKYGLGYCDCGRSKYSKISVKAIFWLFIGAIALTSTLITLASVLTLTHRAINN